MYFCDKHGRGVITNQDPNNNTNRHFDLAV